MHKTLHDVEHVFGECLVRIVGMVLVAPSYIRRQGNRANESVACAEYLKLPSTLVTAAARLRSSASHPPPSLPLLPPLHLLQHQQQKLLLLQLLIYLLIRKQ